MHVSCIHVRAWWGRKREKLKSICFSSIFAGVKGAQRRTENELLAESWPLGGGRGRVNLPLVGLFEVLEVCCLVGASTRLEARGLGGFGSWNLGFGEHPGRAIWESNLGRAKLESSNLGATSENNPGSTQSFLNAVSNYNLCSLGSRAGVMTIICWI